MIYICLILLLLLYIFLFDVNGRGVDKSKRKWRVAYYISYLFLCGIPIFSYEIGGDIQRYMAWYIKEVKPLDGFSFDDFRYEPLFCLIISFFKTIRLSWFIVYAIIILFINYSIFSFGSRYITHFFTFILLYFLLHFYEMNFEPIRQSIAMGIFLLSIPFLEEGNIRKYLLLIIVAIGFHISAVFALLLPFFKWAKFNIITYVGLLILLMIGNYINIHFEEAIKLTGLIGGEDYYELYLKSDLVNNQLNVNGIIGLVVVKLAPVILALKMLRYNLTLPFTHFEGAVLLLAIFMVFRAAIPLLDRFVLFWGIIQVAALAEAIYVRNVPRRAKAVNQMFRVYIILSFVLNTYMYYNAPNENDFKNYRRLYPYNSIFDKHIDSERRTKQLYKR